MEITKEYKEYLSEKFFNNMKIKNLKDFLVETPQKNVIKGVICKKANRFLGSMVITEMRVKDSEEFIKLEQFVQAMPKIHYYDSSHEMKQKGQVQYPAYEKLDGSCLILYGLYNKGKLIEVIPKTRGLPVADSHIIDMFNEFEHSNIECFFEDWADSNPTLLFELYGALNQHSIFYPKTRIDIRLIGGSGHGDFLNDFELDYLCGQYDFIRPNKLFNVVFYNGTWKIRLLPPGLYAYYLYYGMSQEEIEELSQEEFSTQLDVIQAIKDKITIINKNFSEKFGRQLLEGVVLNTDSLNDNFMYLKVKSADIEERCRAENGVPRKFILKEVHKYFDEYGSSAKEIYQENENHVIEYVNRNLLEEFDRTVVEMKRTQLRIKNVFLDMLEAKEPPKGLQDICNELVEKYPESDVSDLMRIFAQEYPEKKRHARIAYSILEKLI